MPGWWTATAHASTRTCGRRWPQRRAQRPLLPPAGWRMAAHPVLLLVHAITCSSRAALAYRTQQRIEPATLPTSLFAVPAPSIRACDLGAVPLTRTSHALVVPLPACSFVAALAAAAGRRLCVISDFLLFCKLVAAKGLAAPRDGQEWEWPALITAAGGMLDKGFNPEQCGAHYRYGEVAGGESMRRVASLVYDSSTAQVDELRGAIVDACWGEDTYDAEGHLVHQFSFERGADIFKDVGGAPIWILLNDKLKAGRLG